MAKQLMLFITQQMSIAAYANNKFIRREGDENEYGIMSSFPTTKKKKPFFLTNIIEHELKYNLQKYITFPPNSPDLMKLSEQYCSWLSCHRYINDQVEDFRKNIADIAASLLPEFPPYQVIAWEWFGFMN